MDDTEFQKKVFECLGFFVREYKKVLFAIPNDRDALILHANKINSNLHASLFLVEKIHVHEAQIVLRSAFESVILLWYFHENPEEVITYERDCSLLELKNEFILLKQLIQFAPVLEKTKNNENFSLEDCKKDFINIFLPAVQSDKFDKLSSFKSLNLSDLNSALIDKIDKELSGFHPIFMSIGKLLRIIKEPFPENSTLKDNIWVFYNKISQIAHGKLEDWIEKPELSKKTLRKLSLMITRIITLTVCIIEKEVSIQETTNFKNNTKTCMKELNELINNKF